jgi:outer membrane murein-binding lipoprotein Lpp
MRGRNRILLHVSMLIVVLALAAAGCGGGKSAEEEWADEVCTQVQTWNKQIRQLADDAKSAASSPDATTIDRLKTEAQEAVTATDKLRTDLQDLPPAPGENGQTARETITSFANQTSQTVSALKTSVSRLPSSSNASQAATALAATAGHISILTAQAKSAVSTLEQMSSELKSGFEDADSCEDLRS